MTVSAYHHLLLRLAGRLPDDLITEARRWLASGQLVDVARGVAFGAMACRVEMRAADVRLIRETLVSVGGKLDLIDELGISERDRMPPYLMSPVPPGMLVAVADEVPCSLDLTELDDGLCAADAVDLVAVDSMSEFGAYVRPVGLWRAWRIPAADTRWPLPRRVYFVQVEAEPEDLPSAAAVVQKELESAGEDAPQVEVFIDADELPLFQSAALVVAAHLWSPDPVRAAPW